MASHLVPRAALSLVTRALRRSPVVAIVGPRQCGKTWAVRASVRRAVAVEPPGAVAEADHRTWYREGGAFPVPPA